MRLLPVFGVILTLTACGDPLAGVGRLSDVDVAGQDPAAAALPDAEEIARDGFLGTSAAEGAAPTEPAEAAVAATTPAPERGGFLRGLINRAANADPAAAVAADVAAAQSRPADAVVIDTTPLPATGRPVEMAALEPETLSPREELSSPRRGGIGLFGSRTKRDKPRTGPDQLDVPYGTVLAFGEIARVCDARGKPLGKKLGGQGRRGFALYDSKPGTTGKRTHYITGFGDNCPRQFTAANALFGAPSFYEQIRFSPAGKHQPFAATDQAYDKVKSSVCRTGKNTPCGGKRIGKLDDATAFVSAYEFGEYNKKWKEFLIHDGEVLASAVKSFK